MKKRYRTLTAIEYAFVVSLMASFSVLVVAGLLFGFQVNQWTEWQGVLVGLVATIAGVVGAVVGLRIALNERLMNLKNHGHTARWIKH
ncbi:MAG TPA: hypothetical protein VF074_23445 [Pyrinomonadaceae bacterium]